ncbi:F-box protein [Cardamine amara subsp. amara]|uniref:F-box protein n=1 Tax=Cardamine amara subsp. amara TaxID=228776 RepID=A0ABD1B6I0_CARAN
MISDSTPNDLILEILSRLPAKSVAMFRCVSKLWAYIFGGPDFTKLFLTRSSARLRLLFALEEEDGVWSFFSLPQRQQSSSSLVVSTEFHMKFPPENMYIYSRRSRQFSCGYASGLIYFYAVDQRGFQGGPVICNPNTGWYATLPDLLMYRKCYSFFGFDPINKQFKVLFMAYPSGPDEHKILTFGTRKMRWRTIECSLTHDIASEGICINGVLYYLGWVDDEMEKYLIVCFDVKFEKLKLEILCDELINYKGKLGVIYYDHRTNDAIDLSLWVLEDIEKQEWSKYAYNLRYDRFFRGNASVIGVTATDEIVLSMGDYTYEEPFYVYYFNPERNTIQRVEI